MLGTLTIADYRRACGDVETDDIIDYIRRAKYLPIVYLSQTLNLRPEEIIDVLRRRH